MAKVTDDYDKDAILGFLEGKSMHTVGRYVCSALVINEVQHVSKLWTQPHLGFIPFPLWKPVHRIDPNEALSIIQTAGFTIDKLPITGEM